MLHWIFVQHPYVLLVLGALLALTLVCLGVIFRRLYDYWLWARSREQRERDVIIVACASLAAMQLAAIAHQPTPLVHQEDVVDVQ